MRDRFHWARLLAFVTGLVNHELEQHDEALQPSRRPHLYTEEVRRHDDAPMPREELLPSCPSVPLGRGLDTVAMQNVCNRATGDVVAEIRQCTLNSTIAQSRFSSAI